MISTTNWASAVEGGDVVVVGGGLSLADLMRYCWLRVGLDLVAAGKK